ncbi:MAG TPA: DUF4173 domain-containing protein [bacterium]|nr:DUF4173 domain-containing protein [bacterium]
MQTAPQQTWLQRFGSFYSTPAATDRPGRQLAFLIGGIVIADLLLWQNYSGITGGLAILIAGLGFGLYHRERFTRRPVYLTLCYLALIAAACCWSATLLPLTLGIVMVPLFAVVAAAPTTHFPESLVFGSVSIAGGGAGLLYNAGEFTRRLRRVNAAGNYGCLAIVLPALAAFLAIVIFGGIFIFANPVVEHLWDALDLHLGDLFPSFGHCCFWVAVAWYLAGAFVPFLPADVLRWLASLPEQLDREAPRQGSRLEALIAIAVLGAVTLLFLAYNLLDANYLWLRAGLPADITYSQYSRQGTAWLTLALLLSTLVIGAATSLRLAFHPWAKCIRLLAYAWAALDLVLAVGVLRRIQLYVAYNGLTALRIVGIVGTLLVIAGLLIMVAKIARQRNLVWIIRRDCLAFAVALVALAAFPSDWVCARFNVHQALHGNSRPLVWLAEQENDLTSEALPALLPLLDHPDTVVRSGIAAYLGTEYRRLSAVIAGDTQAPAPRGLSDYWAHRRLTARQEALLLHGTSDHHQTADCTALYDDEYRHDNPAWREFKDYVRRWRNGSRDSSRDD